MNKYYDLKKFKTQLLDSFKAKKKLTVSEWAEENIVLASEFASERGGYRINRTPYMQEILDSFNKKQIRKITIKSSAQVGKTTSLMIFACFAIKEDPSSIMIVFPTLEIAKSFSFERFDSMVQASPSLFGLLYENEDLNKKRKGTRILTKKFDGGFICFCGSESESALSSRPIKYLFIDELSKCNLSAYDWSEKRTTTFSDRKICTWSTPGIDGLCEITKQYDNGDKSVYKVPCPFCQEYQILRFPNLIFKDEDKNIIDAKYKCQNCKKLIPHNQKNKMVKKGRWEAEIKKKIITHRSFFINELYSPFVTWNEMRDRWLDIQKTKDKLKLKEFKNLSLGEAWEEEGYTINKSSLYMRREEYGEYDIPTDYVVLTAGVDVQKGYIECEVVAWAKNYESYGVEYKTIYGDTSSPVVYKDLEHFLLGTYRNSKGQNLKISCVCIDSGYSRSLSVIYDFLKDKIIHRWYPIKGSSDREKRIVSKPTTQQHGIKLFSIGTHAAKQQIYTHLALTTPGPGYCHFPNKECYNEQYFDMLTAEKLVVDRDKDGRDRQRFLKIKARNEALDCRVYALAAEQIVSPNYDRLHIDEVKEEKDDEPPENKPKNKTIKKKSRVINPGISL